MIWKARKRTYSLSKGLGAVIDPCNEPPLLGLIYPSYTGPTKVLDELGERHPASRVHVKMVFVGDVLLIHLVRPDSLCTKPEIL
jgi:hypothetical protein